MPCPALAQARVPAAAWRGPSAACRCRARGAQLSAPGAPDWCQLPAVPGGRPPRARVQRRPAHKNGRHEAAGGPRGGNQDHIQRGSRLNFQPRACRGAWSCLVNAAGNTWDTLTALIVLTHSAVDELQCYHSRVKQTPIITIMSLVCRCRLLCLTFVSFGFLWHAIRFFVLFFIELIFILLVLLNP